MPSDRQHRAKPPRPTPAELGILRVLWRLESGTVREIQEALAEEEPTGYTTVLKFLQIMHGKGLVSRDESRRAPRKRAPRTQDEARREMTTQLIDRVFDGSTSKLVLAALGDEPPASAEELAEIRLMLDRLEGRKQ